VSNYDTYENIRAITKEELAALIGSAPPQWLTESKKACILELLLERQQRIEALCEQSLGG
jgi:hypothetical protein